MHRINNFNRMGHLPSQTGHGAENLTHWLTPIFPPMAGEQHNLFVPINFFTNIRPQIRFQITAVRHGLQQSVNHGVPGDKNLLGGNAIMQQVLPGSFGRRKMEVRQLTGQTAVNLLGIGSIFIAGAQARFHMAHRNTLVKSGQSTGKRGCGIAVHQHHMRLFRSDNLLQPNQSPAGHIRQSLPVLHHIQVKIRVHIKTFQHLVQHFPVLGRHRHLGLKAAVCLQCFHQRRHLNCFRPRAENQ